MAKIVCVPHPDRTGAHPPKPLRDDIPSLQRCPDRQSLPTALMVNALDVDLATEARITNLQTR